MTLQSQVDAIVAQQGTTPVEDDLLSSPVIWRQDETDDESTNGCYRVELESGTTAYHKTFEGVHVRIAASYGHEDPDQIPINEAAAWRLAAALGEPVSQLVCVCVLRTIHDEPGSLSRHMFGEPWNIALGSIADKATPAAFFDSLIAQQDRHAGNFLTDLDSLGLIDHGYTFARPGDLLNHSYLVQWRHENGEPTLTEWERGALGRLLASTDLLGLRAILLPDRADALTDRARRMTATNQILRQGHF
jgi:hypothetical protein